MSVSAGAPVLVGIDAAAHSVTALDLAAWEAARLGVPLRIIHVYEPPSPQSPAIVPESLIRRQVTDANAVLRHAQHRVRSHHPELPIETLLRVGQPEGTMVQETRRARLCVTGSRQRSGFAAELPGSISAHVAGFAHCPVLIARGGVAHDVPFEVPGEGPVVVGVGASPRTQAALGFAFGEADARNVALIAVHCVPHAAAGYAARALDGALTGWDAKYPDVKIIAEVMTTHRPADALAATCTATAASLVVIGAREPDGCHGLRFGSVCRQLVRHATLPVAVVYELVHEPR